MQLSATVKDTDAVPPSTAPLIALCQVIMSFPDLVQLAPPPLVPVDVLVVPPVDVVPEVPVDPPPVPQLMVKLTFLSPPAAGVLWRTCNV
ncbi:MAG TPA: hypothetical protein VF833_01160 [Gaiellaceae bacterium]